MDDTNDPVATVAEAQLGSSAAIEARGLECEFATKGRVVRAVGPIDFELRDREFACILGPSGCGKSTVLRIIAGLTKPTGGRLRIRLARQSAASPIAMVFQDYGIYPWKDVERNIGFGLEIAGVPVAERRERVARWLHALRLEGFEHAYPHELSGGMRQRVAIARALAVEPEILVMDEPFGAVDPQLRVLLQDEVLRLWQAEARTVAMVTHSIEEALVLSDRVLVMTRRPARLLADVSVPFPRPRDESIRSSPEFLAQRDQLWEFLRGELAATDAPDEATASSA